MMRRTIVRYTVRPDTEEQNAELIRAVYHELAQLRPERFSYVTFRLDGGRTFVHIAEHDDDRDSPLRRRTTFQDFPAGIRDRCDSGPEVREAHQLGRFGT